MSDPHATWKGINGDETLALDWDITPRSRVWEIGGFNGRWAGQMVEKYNPHMDIFEPQPWAVERLQQRFGDNHKVTIHPYGLWVMDCSLPLYHYETDGATLLGDGHAPHVCRFRDVFLEVQPVDVCLMNIEGGEYILIPYLLGLGLMCRFRYFWCQFHTFVAGSQERTQSIYLRMAETHTIKWDYFPTAVCWERDE